MRQQTSAINRIILSVNLLVAIVLLDPSQAYADPGEECEYSIYKLIEELESVTSGDLDQSPMDCARHGSATAQFLIAMLPLYATTTSDFDNLSVHYLMESSSRGFAPAQAMVGGVLLEAARSNVAGRQLIESAANSGDEWAVYYRIRDAANNPKELRAEDIHAMEVLSERGFVLANGALALAYMEQVEQLPKSHDGTHSIAEAQLRQNSAWRIARGAALGDPLALSLSIVLFSEPQSVLSVLPLEKLPKLVNLMKRSKVTDQSAELTQEMQDAYDVWQLLFGVFVTDTKTLSTFRTASEFCHELGGDIDIQKYCEIRALADAHYCRDPADYLQLTQDGGRDWLSTKAYRHCRSKRLGQAIDLNYLAR